MKLAFTVFLAVAALAGPAAAGNPQSTGLTLTEAEARRAAASVLVRHNDAACLRSAAQNLSAIPGVREVKVTPGLLRASFVSPAHAGQAEGEVRASLAAACPAPGPAATPAS